MSERARLQRTAPRRARLALLAALLCGLGACGGSAYTGHTGFVATNPAPRPLQPRPAAEVALIERAAEPGAQDPALARPHVEVGLIEVIGDDEWGAAERAALRERLRARAAGHGCDAVVLLGEIDWVYEIENAHSTAERHGYRGVCIVYR
jgi:hypothetical protein